MFQVQIYTVWANMLKVHRCTTPSCSVTAVRTPHVSGTDIDGLFIIGQATPMSHGVEQRYIG